MALKAEDCWEAEHRVIHSRPLITVVEGLVKAHPLITDWDPVISHSNVTLLGAQLSHMAIFQYFRTQWPCTEMSLLQDPVASHSNLTLLWDLVVSHSNVSLASVTARPSDVRN